MKGILAVLLMGFATWAVADEPVYRYVDADGVVHYTDRAPDRHAKPIRFAATPGSTRGMKAVYSPEALRLAAGFAVRIESPTPDQRVPADTVPLVAAASVMPGLVKGFHLVYQVDGSSATAAPVDALSIALQPLTAGPHELLVILLDEHHREVARSEKSRFQVESRKLKNVAPKRS